MASSSKILSLNGKGLKLDTRADVEPWIKGIDPTTIEEIHLGGNTIGVDASTALAEFLAKATNLKVGNNDDTVLSADSGGPDCRLCGHIYWPPDLRNTTRAFRDLRCAEGQDVPR